MIMKIVPIHELEDRKAVSSVQTLQAFMHMVAGCGSMSS